MEDLSLLWVAGVLIAVLGLEGCALSPPGTMSQLPPVPSASDTNRFSTSSAVSSSTEVSGKTSDNPSIRGDGTTGAATATRR
jgi:hypothetical protein